MNQELRRQTMPDVAQDAAADARALDWVGMEGIALPLRVPGGLVVPAEADFQVSLDQPNARGIHMSRLFLLLQDGLAAVEVDAASVAEVVRAGVASQSGLSGNARLLLRWRQLLQRPALATAHAGWREYPVQLETMLRGEEVRCTLQIELLYSSTCPASAALSRQVVAERFIERFPDGGQGPEIAAWLATPAGMAATPHAQRSCAVLRVDLPSQQVALPLESVIDAVESALGTPVQTAVKREDERAFAEANAAHLMFCEDAARRIAAALTPMTELTRFEIRVAHLESLHAHDAVAMVTGSAAGAR